MTLDQSVRRMRGEPGTKITITIFRKSEDRTFPVTITRAEIKVQSVKAKFLEDGIAYVRITSFQERTIPDLAKKLNELYAKTPQIKGVILDLRNNGGGLLQGAVGVSAAFLQNDALVVSTKGQSEDAKQLFNANFSNYRLSESKDALAELAPIFKKVPMVVMVNAFSASASEIVAGALQDHKRATIIGKTTFGKGSVQTVRPLSADSALKLTTAYYYTPTGKSIQAFGVKPDIPVDQNAEGDPDDVLITREIDSEKHLKNKQASEEKLIKDREKRRLEELQRIEEINAKKTTEEKDKDRKKNLPEFGTAEDFMLTQASAYLKGQPVKRSKSRLE
jgi:carboxyl-terminal processing protease